MSKIRNILGNILILLGFLLKAEGIGFILFIAVGIIIPIVIIPQFINREREWSWFYLLFILYYPFIYKWIKQSWKEYMSEKDN